MNVKSIIENPPFKLSDDDVKALLGQSDEFRPYEWAHLKNIIGIPLPLKRVLGKFLPAY
jgi:hypothetical protein